MGRIIKVSLYVVVILVLYFWITSIMNTMGKNNEKDNPPIPVADTTIISSDFDTTIMDDDEKPLSNEDIVSGKISYNDVDQTLEKLEVEKKNQKTELNTKSNEKPALNTQQETKPAKKPEVVQTKIESGSAEGDYMVIAGSYILEENANKMARKLRELGYPNAGVVIFTASEYHSVVAVRHHTQEKAQLSAEALKRQGIDCFVKRKN